MKKQFMVKATNRDFKKSIDSKYQGACVEAAVMPDGTVVRDTKNRKGGSLHFTPLEWKAFISGVKRGEFDSK